MLLRTESCLKCQKWSPYKVKEAFCMLVRARKRTNGPPVIQMTINCYFWIFHSCSKCSCCFQSSLVKFLSFQTVDVFPKFFCCLPEVCLWPVLARTPSSFAVGPYMPRAYKTCSVPCLLTLSELSHCTADNCHETNKKETCSYMMEQSAASARLISRCQ